MKEMDVKESSRPKEAIADSGSARRLWHHEYKVRQGINLGYDAEDEPPAVRLFKSYLSRVGRAAPDVLDVGCGRGRIGLHLLKHGHRVTAFDFVDTVVEEFRVLADSAGVARRLHAFQQDMTEQWQLDDAGVDAVFAITVLNNLIDVVDQQYVKQEICRVLKPKGLLVLETYLPEDGYYGELLADDDDGAEGVCEDAHNGLLFKIFSRNEVIELFAPEFRTLEQQTRAFTSIKYDARYERRSILFLLERQD